MLDKLPGLGDGEVSLNRHGDSFPRVPFGEVSLAARLGVRLLRKVNAAGVAMAI